MIGEAIAVVDLVEVIIEGGEDFGRVGAIGGGVEIAIFGGDGGVVIFGSDGRVGGNVSENGGSFEERRSAGYASEIPNEFRSGGGARGGGGVDVHYFGIMTTGWCISRC